MGNLPPIIIVKKTNAKAFHAITALLNEKGLQCHVFEDK